MPCVHEPAQTTPPPWTTTLVTSGGQLTVQRHSRDAEHRARLMHTARVLDTIDHPQVECFLALEDDGLRTTLVTAYAGGRTLATSVPPRAAPIAAVVASLARCLGDLHACGITHGPLRASQVRFGDGWTPTLCDFDQGRVHSVATPATWAGDRAVDVQSLGALLTWLLDDAHTPGFRRSVFERIDRRRLARLAARISRGECGDAAAVAAALKRLSPKAATSGAPRRRSGRSVARSRPFRARRRSR